MNQEPTEESVETELPDEPSCGPWAYLPSPEEIAAACRQIQTEWSDEERRRRAAGPREQTVNRRMRAYAAYHGVAKQS